MKTLFRLIAPVLIWLRFDKFLLSLSNNNMLVLVYHGVSHNPDRHNMNIDQFRKDIKYLSKNFNIIPLETMFKVYQSGGRYSNKTISITFDDGFCNSIIATDILDGIPATFFVTGLSTLSGTRRIVDRLLLDYHQLKRLSEVKGVTIGCHSKHHSDYATMSLKSVEVDMIQTKQDIESVIGKPCDFIAYTYGSYNEEIKDKATKIGHKYQLAVKYKSPLDKRDQRIMPRHCVSNTTTHSSNMLQICNAFRNGI